MFTDLHVVLLSSFLFLIGLLGCFVGSLNIIKTVLSIEMMMLAATVNFCCVDVNDSIQIGDIFSVVSIVISGIVFGIIFSMSIKRKGREKTSDE